MVISMQKSKLSTDFFHRYWWSKNPATWLDRRYNSPHLTKSGSLRSYFHLMVISLQKNLRYRLIPSRDLRQNYQWRRYSFNFLYCWLWEGLYLFVYKLKSYLNNMLPVEQKGCKKKSRGIKDKLLIDRTILHDCRKRHTNLGMAWIDYKKAYDMAPHSRILESLDLVQASDNISNLWKDQWQIGKQSWPHAEKVWWKLTSGEGFFRVIVYHLCYLRYAWY